MYLDSTNLVVTPVPAARVIGRYLMYEEIAAGGMASVHFARLLGAVGFARIVAIKRLHSHRADDREFVSMFVDEVRVAARIQHPNVASPLDVVLDGGEIFLVMEYIQGDTLARLLTNARLAQLVIPPAVTAAIVTGALRGLHAAHEAVDENRQPLNIIHRDVSPQNIMVGVDGVGRVLDFGVAKSMYRCQATQQGHLKGKLSYMAPEQMQTGPLDRRVDVFAAGIVLWEALTHQRLFMFDNLAAGLSMILNASIARPSQVRSQVPPALDDVVMKALQRDANARFQSAREFADAIEGAIPLASPGKVGEWVERLCGEALSKRAEIVTNIERSTFDDEPGLAGQDPLLHQPALVTPRPVVVAVPPAAEPSTVEQGSLGMLPSMEVVYVGNSDSLSHRLSCALSRRRHWLPWGLSALGGLATVGLLIHLVGIQVARRANGDAEPPSSRLAARPTVSSPAVGMPTSAPAVDQSVSTPESGKRSIRRPKQAWKKDGKADSASTKKDCATPYTIDARGIRRVKPYCQ